MPFRSPQAFTILTPNNRFRLYCFRLWLWHLHPKTHDIHDMTLTTNMTEHDGGRSQLQGRNASTRPAIPAKVLPARDVYVERTPMLDYVTILEAGKAILDSVLEPSQQTKQESNPGNRPMQQCPWQFQTPLNQTIESPLRLLRLLNRHWCSCFRFRSLGTAFGSPDWRSRCCLLGRCLFKCLVDWLSIKVVNHASPSKIMSLRAFPHATHFREGVTKALVRDHGG